MNAMMRIHVRVTSASAAAMLKQMQAQVTALSRATQGASAATAHFGGPVLRDGLRNLERYGKNLQWVGRQIEFNFTLPLVLAGAAATKWAFESETAFIRVAKVYQETEGDAYNLRQELDLLQRGFRALSDEFGVHLDEVNEIGAAWAQAGASGIALAKATRLTLEAMILGDLEAAEATEALIAVQSQYELSSEDMQRALADLNKISNITTVGFGDLIDALQRGGGIARQAGVTIREFAAMTASLVPAAGNARQAGNALRTIISRIMAPTNQAMELFRELGLEIDESAWHSKNFTDRLMELRDGLNEVSTSQRNVALSVIGSRWQVARLSVLFSDLTNEQGRYATALEGTRTAEESMRTYRKELEIFLTSTPQGFKILTNQIRNFAQDIIQQVLPALLGVLSRIRDLMKSFTELSPRVQQIVIGLLLMLAVMGTLVRYIGASILVVKTLATTFLHLGGFVVGAGRMMLLFAAGETSKEVIAGMGRMARSVLWLRGALIAVAAAPFSFIAKGFLAIRSGMGALFAFIATAWRAFLGGTLLRGIIMPALAKVGAVIVAAFTGPWVLAIAAVIGLLALFGNEIASFIRGIANQWDIIPEGVARAMRSVIDIIKTALSAVGRMFSSFFGGSSNIPTPHPPTGGATGGAQEYATGGRVPGQGKGDTVPALLTPGEFVMTKDAVRKYGVPMMEAINAQKFANGGLVPPALSNFLSATAGARASIAAAEVAEKREIVLSFAPGAGSEFDALVAAIAQFTRRADELSAQIRVQEAVVNRWSAALDQANLRLDEASDRLSELRDNASAIQSELNAAESTLSDLMNTPIEGMQEYSDALFENEMAQKQLRLEILRMQDAGGSIDDIKNKLAALSGEIEMLRGRREDLRLAGAGSDVLAGFDQDIKALEAQRKALMGGGGGAGDNGISDLQAQLDELERQAEMLRLEESINFDPMRRQIDQTVNSMQEMPFDQLLASIQSQQEVVNSLTADYEKANKAVEDQEAVVARLTVARDEIKRTYDAEKASLDSLKDSYSIVTDQIRDMQAALDQFVASASAAQSAAGGDDPSKIVENFRNAVGDFEIPGGTGSIAFEEGDLAALVEEWEAELASTLGNFDLFKPLRDQWNKVVDWFRNTFSGFSVSIGFDGAFQSIRETFSGVTDWFKSRIDRWVGNFEPLRNAWNDIRDMLSAWADQIRETFGGEGGAAGAVNTFANVMQVAGWIVKTAANLIMDAINLIVLIVTGAFTLVWPVVANVIEQFGGAVIEIFGAIWTIISGFIDWVAYFFTGQWSAAGEAVIQILTGMWDLIYGIFRGAVRIVAGFVMGLVEGIADFFKWLWDVLVGNSIIPDTIKAIISWFQKLTAPIRAVWNAIWNAIKWVWNNGIKVVWQAIQIYWNSVLKPVFNVMRTVISGVWNGIKDVIGRAWAGIKVIWQGLLFYWNNVLKPAVNAIRTVFSNVWNGVKDMLSRVWNNSIKKVFDSVKSAVEGLPRAFQTAKDGIGRIWDGIKSIVGKPVKWLADNVMNRLIGAFNAIAGKVPGLPTLPLMSVPQFHEGGVVGEGGRNRNLARQPLRSDETIAVLRNGERVLTEEERRWYEQNDPNAIRHVGGPFDFIGDAVSAVGGAAQAAGRAVLDGVRDVAATVARPLVNGALSALDGLPIGGWFGDALRGNARMVGDAVLKWIDGTADEAKRLTPSMSNIVEVGRQIQKMGYHVAEHPEFGGVAPVHSANSYHYRGQAIDVNYYPAEDEPGKLDRLYGWIKANIDPAMIRELIWRAPGHWGHLHLAMGGGATGWYGPATGGSGATGRGSGSGTAGMGQTATGGHLLDNGGVFTRPTTGTFTFAKSAMARPEIASPVPLLRSVFRDEIRRSGGGERTLNFYGDLEFPNVKSGEDAEEFIKNLESLAG